MYDCHYARTTCRASRFGFSILEVMVALAILISTVLLAVGQFTNVASVQRDTEESTAVDRILQGLVERVNAVPFTQLGTVRAPWSVARYEVLSPSGSPPMRVGGNAADDLVALGLVSSVGSLPSDLRIYFEYYRAVDYTDGQNVLHEGLLDEAPTSSQAFDVACYINPIDRAQGVKSVFRLDTTIWDCTNTADGSGPGQVSGLLGETDPLLIRVIAVWRWDATAAKYITRRELFTARAP